jgi:hypothetical protein
MTYTLLHCPLGHSEANWGKENSLGDPHSTHDTLQAAMDAAGHPHTDDWFTAVGIPDHVYVDWKLYFQQGLQQFIAEGRGTAEDYEEYDENGLLIYLASRWVITGPGAADEFNRCVGLPAAPSNRNDSTRLS